MATAVRFVILFILFVLSATSARATDAASAVEWNAAVLAVAEAEDGFMTLKGLRTVTMMHLAMHDALSATGSGYEPYALQERVTGASRIAAVSQAAFVVASSQYPGSRADFALLRDHADTGVSEPDHIERGRALGTRAARSILSAREGDGWDTEAGYQWHPMAPGVYAEFQEHSGTPQGFVFGPGWANARGFALQRPDQFRVPPPPDIKSSAYTAAFDEVKMLGRFQSIRRTPDQTHLALWWKDFSENSHNRLARDLVVREALSLDASVRLFALLNMAIYDAYVSSFENKFHYNHWRPYTAIRWADNDGNPETQQESTWTNTHGHTYAFPSYPSAHGTACAAAMSAMTHVFGDEFAFTMRTEMVDLAGPFSGKIEMHPATRSFERFSDAARECGASRVYLGIHFRYDSVAGVQLGEQVGGQVIATRLQPREPKSVR
ncbi:MAG: vanadium-dependent haloperoxidase [Pseudomonadota bacterium]